MKLVVTVFLMLAYCVLHAGESNILTLTRTIPLPDIHGRIDHFALDNQGSRLFMAALGNDTVEVFNLAAGKRVDTIRDCSEPQGLVYVPSENRLVVANGGSGIVKILDGASFKQLTGLPDLPDADNVRYDAAAGFVYVGYGDGALAVIRATNGEKVASIKLAGHPESFQLETQGNRIFVNVPGAGQVAVVDRFKREVVATWSTGNFGSNFPMALDEVNHRLFVGCRHPARMVVLDTQNGRKVTDLEIPGDADDLFYDANRKLIYVSGGEGYVDVIQQNSADTYTVRQRVPTVSGARTSFFSTERGELYVAVRAGIFSGQAEVRVFRISN